MKKIKNPSVAGRFYPNNTDELLNLFKQYENDIKIDSNYISQLVISPHAGYIYSARCAYQALKHIKGENIFIFSIHFVLLFLYKLYNMLLLYYKADMEAIIVVSISVVNPSAKYSRIRSIKIATSTSKERIRRIYKK